MSRQTEFQLSPSLRLAGTSVAKAEKGAVCPADPPCKWEGAVVQWLLLITTKQLQTHRATAKGAQPYCQARGQALQCGEATGGPLCSSLPSAHSHAMRPPLQPSAPAASSTSLAEIAGWQGNHVCKYDRTDKEMSWSLFSWLGLWGGRYVCLDPCTPWQLLNSGPRQEGKKKKTVTFRQVQSGLFSQTQKKDTVASYKIR